MKRLVGLRFIVGKVFMLLVLSLCERKVVDNGLSKEAPVGLTFMEKLF